MMKMSKHGDMEAIERQIRLWLEKRGIPQQRYENLQPFDKDVLHNLVCTPTHPTTYNQRRDLYRKLCLPESMVAGRNSIDPLDFIPDEELRKFFSPLPLTPGEKLPDLYKY